MAAATNGSSYCALAPMAADGSLEALITSLTSDDGLRWAPSGGLDGERFLNVFNATMAWDAEADDWVARVTTDSVGGWTSRYLRSSDCATWEPTDDDAPFALRESFFPLERRFVLQPPSATEEVWEMRIVDPFRMRVLVPDGPDSLPTRLEHRREERLPFEAVQVSRIAGHEVGLTRDSRLATRRGDGTWAVGEPLIKATLRPGTFDLLGGSSMAMIFPGQPPTDPERPVELLLAYEGDDGSEGPGRSSSGVIPVTIPPPVLR